MMNLNSIWSQVVGADSSEEDDSFHLKQSLPTEDDIAASALLSQFPPFGYHKQRHDLSPSSPGGGGGGGGPNAPSSPNGGSSEGYYPSTHHGGSMPPSSPRMRKAMSGNVPTRGPPVNTRSKYLQSKNVSVGPIGASTSQEEYFHIMKMEQEKEEVGLMTPSNDGVDMGMGGVTAGGGRKSKPLGESWMSPNGGAEDNTTWKSEEQHVWYSSAEDDPQPRPRSKQGKQIKRKKQSKRIVMEDLMEVRQSWILGKHPSPSNASDTSSLQGVILPTPSPLSNKNQNGPTTGGGPTTKTSLSSRHFTFSFDDGESTTCSSSFDGEDETSQIHSVTDPPLPSPSALPLMSNQFTSWKKHDEDTSHWMPDQFAKQCYACESQFTVFRRRHHCRLCGQVFCSRCSSSFVDIHGDRVRTRDRDNAASSSERDGRGSRWESMEDVRTIRTCQKCHDQVAKSGNKGLSWFGMESNGNVAQPDLERHGSNNSLELDGLSLKLSTNSSESTNTSLNAKFGHTVRKFHPSASVPPDIQELEEDSQSTHSNSSNLSNQLVGFRTSGSPNEFSNLAIVKQTIEEKRMQRKEQERIQKAESEKELQVKVGIVGKTTSSIRGRFGRLAESAAREAQVGDAGFDDDEAKLIGTGVKISDDCEKKQDDSRFTKKEQIVLPPPNDEGDTDTRSGVKREDKYAKSLKVENRRLGLAAADHLEVMARELLISEAPLLLKEMRNREGPSVDVWIDKLMELITRCCATVNTDVRGGDTLDIRPYCKVKGK